MFIPYGKLELELQQIKKIHSEILHPAFQLENTVNF